MNQLFIIDVSTGAPRQRTWRTSYRVMVSEASASKAKASAEQFVQAGLDNGQRSSYGHKARADAAEFVCATPDAVTRWHGGTPSHFA